MTSGPLVTPAPAVTSGPLVTPTPDMLGSTTPPPEVVLRPVTPAPAPIASPRFPPRAVSPAPNLQPFVPSPYRSPLGTTPVSSKQSSGRHNLPHYLQQPTHPPARQARRMVRGVTLSKSALAGIWLMAFALGMVTTVIVERFRPSAWSEPPPPPTEPPRAVVAPARGPGVEIVTLPPPAEPEAPPPTAPSPPSPPAK